MKKRGICLILILVCLVTLAGIFCHQGIQMSSDSCHSASSVMWCSDFLEHGSIISGAMLVSIVTLFAVVFVFCLSQILSLLVFRLENFATVYVPNSDFKIPIASPVALALADGIVHPRIP